MSMNKTYYHDLIKYCQYCGFEYKINPSQNEYVFKCENCQKVRFIKSHPAVCIIIPEENYPEKVILSTRNIEPGIGKLELTGGFVNYHESAEDAIIRETKEELGIEITIDRFLYSFPTYYDYKGINESLLSIFFVAKSLSQSEIENISIDQKEVSNIRKISLKDSFPDINEFAFEAEYNSLKKYYLSLRN
jgi:NAD+ diphosphatase